MVVHIIDNVADVVVVMHFVSYEHWVCMATGRATSHFFSDFLVRCIKSKSA